MNIVIDPQAAGVRDDGTESGVVRVEGVRGDLVPVPLKRGQYEVFTSGTSSVSTQESATPSNEDGSASAVNITTVAGTGEGAGIRTNVWGKVIGVRWRRDGSAPPFTVIVDGEAYSIPSTLSQPHYQGNTLGITDAHAYCVVATDLADGPHDVAVEVDGDPSVNKSLIFYGFLLERRAGYQPYPRLASLVPPVAVSTSAVAVGYNAGNSNQLRWLRSIHYLNTTGGDLTITLLWNSAVIWSKLIAGGDTVVYDPRDRFAPSAFLTHVASGAGIVATVYGGT